VTLADTGYRFFTGLCSSSSKSTQLDRRMNIDAKRPAAPTAPAEPRNAALRRAAEDLEAAFLAEMLKPMGAGATPAAFGGGTGEAQFSSFLVQEEARAMAASGGIGLAESIFQAMLKHVEPDSGE
jgi:Rod binding domain-containing protein